MPFETRCSRFAACSWSLSPRKINKNLWYQGTTPWKLASKCGIYHASLLLISPLLALSCNIYLHGVDLCKSNFSCSVYSFLSTGLPASEIFEGELVEKEDAVHSTSSWSWIQGWMAVSKSIAEPTHVSMHFPDLNFIILIRIPGNHIFRETTVVLTSGWL